MAPFTFTACALTTLATFGAPIVPLELLDTASLTHVPPTGGVARTKGTKLGWRHQAHFFDKSSTERRSWRRQWIATHELNLAIIWCSQFSALVFCFSASLALITLDIAHCQPGCCCYYFSICHPLVDSIWCATSSFVVFGSSYHLQVSGAACLVIHFIVPSIVFNLILQRTASLTSPKWLNSKHT